MLFSCACYVTKITIYLLIQEQPQHQRVIPLSLLDCESCFYWQVLCKYFREKGLEGEEFLERITPTLTHFCTYLDSFMEEMLLADKRKNAPVEEQLQLEFMAQQLLALLPSLDFSDEVGRLELILAELLYNGKFLDWCKFCIFCITPLHTKNCENFCILNFNRVNFEWASSHVEADRVMA